ncbi:MAG TPA: homoserine dehydrogenase, partial [Prolixibacteraceae bacterium]|nr:homoserine dehydrogenase [Prolixibacteraceae bacterium]
MNAMRIAILGCGTVGGGVARIILDVNRDLDKRASRPVELKKIVELKPSLAMYRFALPQELFCGGGKDLSPGEAAGYITDIIHSDDIDLVVETIGGTSDFVHDLCVNVLRSGKHLVTANKALLAERGQEIFAKAEESGAKIGFEAAVCGAIPIVKTLKESLTGDQILSVSGILNGTSNYILSRMQNENLTFADALKLAQESGYAEADPT